MQFNYPPAPRRAWLLLALCLSLSAGCAVQRSTVAVAPAVAGYSGMTRLDPETYLVAHDVKSIGPRLGLLRVVGKGPPQYRPLDSADWPAADNRAADLEALCALPDGGLLAVESGSAAGREGRIFYFELSGDNVRLRRTLPLPTGGAGPNNFEGLACAPRRDGKALLLLGERGGSTPYPQGLLYWGVFDPATVTLSWSPSGRVGAAVNPPGLWLNARERRAIADLYLDGQGQLWAVATEDSGDDGPFRSIIYRAATVRPDNDPPVLINPAPRAAWIVDGLKVEALAGPAAAIAGSVLSVGADDENYGGVWRPLPRSLTDCDCKPEEAVPTEYRSTGRAR